MNIRHLNNYGCIYKYSKRIQFYFQLTDCYWQLKASNMLQNNIYPTMDPFSNPKSKSWNIRLYKTGFYIK